MRMALVDVAFKNVIFISMWAVHRRDCGATESDGYGLRGYAANASFWPIAEAQTETLPQDYFEIKLTLRRQT